MSRRGRDEPFRIDRVAVVDGRMTLEEVRRVTRQAVNGPTRVRRREGETVAWRRGGWPMNVSDVLLGGSDTYRERVTAWARSIRDTLERG